VIRLLVLVAGCLMLAGANAQVPPSFGVCAACHTTDGSARVGPSLKGVYGRKAGSLAGFAYSRAMRKSGAAWDDKSLDAFIAEPQKAIPGTTMPFGGISDPKQRAEIVDYLKTLP
jgi:cytochrome c